MSRRFNNKRLLYLLAGLIVILLLTVVIKIPKEKATLKNKIVDFDTSEVSKIILYPRISNGNAVEFNRRGVKWTVQQGNIVAATQEGAVPNMFGDVLNIKPENLAAISKSKWKEFDLTDSLATRIKFFSSKGKILADLMIGKFDYKQPDKIYKGYNGNNVQITTYVRLANGEEIYGVDGLLTFTFNIKFEDWRDKTFIRSKKNDITRITFTYPADSSYTLSRKDSVWYAGTLKADSASIVNYLNSLSFLSGQDFKDNYKPVINPVYQILVEGNNLLNFFVKCYKDENSDEFILNSSLNQDVYFTSKKQGIFDQIFKPKSNFLKKAKKH